MSELEAKISHRLRKCLAQQQKGPFFFDNRFGVSYVACGAPPPLLPSLFL
jgi:hypothetical protein